MEYNYSNNQSQSNNQSIIKNLPKEERPYEKCMEYGCSSLTNAELLAIILRTGSIGESSVTLARKILGEQSDLSKLMHCDLSELCKIKGIGKVKGIQILCIGELVRRISKNTAQKRISFRNPKSIADYYMDQLRFLEKEVCILMMFNTRNQLIAEEIISIGTVNASLISAREIFISALKRSAVYIIIVHNHPSGDSSPSKEDILVTKQIGDAGRLIGIELIDHIIIGDKNFTSCREEKLM